MLTPIPAKIGTICCCDVQVNQIGSLSESIQAAQDARAAGWGVMVSHRSGEVRGSERK